MLVERHARLGRNPAVPAADAALVPPAREDVRDVRSRTASTAGLWYGSACSIVRKRMFFVRCAAAAKSAVGLAEIENFGKKKCSITA